eukprot:12246923-Prorocentrum_lima.AAC.1
MLREKKGETIQDNLDVNSPSKALHPAVPLPAVVVDPPSLSLILLLSVSTLVQRIQSKLSM